MEFAKKQIREGVAVLGLTGKHSHWTELPANRAGAG